MRLRAGGWAGIAHGWTERRAAALGAAALLAALTACSGGATVVDQTARQGAAAPTSSAPPAAPAVRFGVKPANGAIGVSPTTRVVVTASSGTLAAVALRNDAGKGVRGTLSADRRTWRSAEPLGYGKTYAVSASGVNAEGSHASTSSLFTTITPVTYTMPYLFPSTLRTVGIGQPVTVHFDEAIADKAAAEKALTVTATPAMAGGWYWFDDQNVHWRPRAYWRPGTKVTVSVKVYGVDVGNGIYGQQDVSHSFTIGPSRIATIDDDTHMMTVRINGKVARTIPVSMGRGGKVTVKGRNIYFTTHSGPHVVQEKHPVKEMSSASYGLPVDDPLGYKEKIPLAVRITGSGEFVHAASWSVADQGVRNVSHGCINISPTNARWFYDTFTYGDVVDIRNTGVPLARYDRFGDWMIPWSEWVAGSALS